MALDNNRRQRQSPEHNYVKACDAFQAWIESTGSQERPKHGGSPRYNYFIYVNEESVDSILNTDQSYKNPRHFLILVDYRRHLEESSRGPTSPYMSAEARLQMENDFADSGDDSWKFIDALQLKSIFLDVWFDRHGWYGYDSVWNGPPFVFYQLSHSATEHTALKNSTPAGLNVYRMMKQIYGAEHPRSICFQDEEASTTLQRLRGYKGGEWIDAFPEYC
jgi:hypothetical protein